MAVRVSSRFSSLEPVSQKPHWEVVWLLWACMLPVMDWSPGQVIVPPGTRCSSESFHHHSDHDQAVTGDGMNAYILKPYLSATTTCSANRISFPDSGNDWWFCGSLNSNVTRFSVPPRPVWRATELRKNKEAGGCKTIGARNGLFG